MLFLSEKSAENPKFSKGNVSFPHCNYFPHFCAGCDTFATESDDRIGYTFQAHVGVSSQPGPGVRGLFLWANRIEPDLSAPLRNDELPWFTPVNFVIARLDRLDRAIQ
jgi:hypothetical protein